MLKYTFNCKNCTYGGRQPKRERERVNEQTGCTVDHNRLFVHSFHYMPNRVSSLLVTVGVLTIEETFNVAIFVFGFQGRAEKTKCTAR